MCIDELTDAIIEDTTHCQICETSIVCGDNDCLIGDNGLCVCIGCAEEIHNLYLDALRDAGVEEIPCEGENAEAEPDPE